MEHLIMKKWKRIVLIALVALLGLQPTLPTSVYADTMELSDDETDVTDEGSDEESNEADETETDETDTDENVSDEETTGEQPSSNTVTMAEYFGLACTEADQKAELSDVGLYVNGRRISYLLEDGGEYYALHSDLREEKIGKGSSFYNVNWKCSKNTGDVIGKITKGKSLSVDEETYLIKHLPYEKLSEYFGDWADYYDDWKEVISYSESLHAFIVGETPDEEETDLKEDEIYQFAKKATKGCETAKEKYKALSNAIVLRCHYDTKKYKRKDKSFCKSYKTTETQAESLFMLRSKKGVCSNYACLYQECCNRLFLPCDFVVGFAGNGSHGWNRVYIGKNSYHVDVTFTDYVGNNYKKASDIRETYFMKSAYDFMGSHTWYGDDYEPEEFSKSWKKINRNNIKTTQQLRRAAVYAAYASRYKKKAVTYKFNITGSGVNATVGAYVVHYGYVNYISSSYKDGVLTITYYSYYAQS